MYIYICSYVCMYVCMCECTYVCMYVCMYVCVCECMYVYMYIYVYVCMYVSMQVCMRVCVYVYIYMCVYRVCQEESARLRDSVPYVKLHRYNPKHLYPKLNGYGDNGQRKMWSSCGFHVMYLASCAQRVTRHAQSRSCLRCGVRDEAGRYAVALAPIDVHERQSAK